MFNIFGWLSNESDIFSAIETAPPVDTSPLVESTWENGWGQTAPHQAITEWAESYAVDTSTNWSDTSSFD